MQACHYIKKNIQKLQSSGEKPNRNANNMSRSKLNFNGEKKKNVPILWNWPSIEVTTAKD